MIDFIRIRTTIAKKRLETTTEIIHQQPLESRRKLKQQRDVPCLLLLFTYFYLLTPIEYWTEEEED